MKRYLPDEYTAAIDAAAPRDLLPINPMRLRAAPDAATVTSGVTLSASLPPPAVHCLDLPDDEWKARSTAALLASRKCVDACRAMGMWPAAFNARFKRLFGTTASGWLKGHPAAGKATVTA